ncbi:MAG: electron transport complex subunit RsxC [Bacteroidaceae bacterium]|nr:electron transport complex subunit RsxC [Bacteroidaceae bacterium]
MKTFSMGGVHPEENKLSAGERIREAALPKQAVFSMFQHIGAPATPVVKRGDIVKVGTLLGEAGGFVSAPVYSSVSGKVSKVDVALDASDTRRMAVYVDVEGDEWEESIDRSTDLVKLSDRPDLDGKTIVEKVKNAGIVGMGGATFPCHVKLCPPPGQKAECVIINAVECEPYLTADHSLMLEHGAEILVGVKLIMKAVDVNKGYIGIENNKQDAISLMTKLAAEYPDIEIVPLKVKYPQGGEKQLIDAVTGRQVPAPPAIPINVGAVVQNVGTAFAIYEAVMKNKPLISRVITVTGKSVKKPSNLSARLGTPFSQLIEECGGLPADTGKVIAGGPMMGKALISLDIPMTKGSSGLLVMNEKEARRQMAEPCIRCAKCVGACPMGLEPYLLANLSSQHIWERAEAEDITSCIECGSCAFTCPSHRPLLDNIRLGKTTVMGIIRSRAAAK